VTGSGPHVRRARLDDIEALLALEARFPTDRISRASFRHLIAHAHADLWVCELDSRLCGNVVVLYRAGSRTARVYSIVVDPAKQGRGLGRLLMDAAEHAATAAGCERIALEVRSDNTPAQALYRDRGYALTRTLEEFYEDGTAARRMEKRLPRRDKRASSSTTISSSASA
jgi:[ribosomal protein S18]-alanine N-acetyltransferase